MEFQIIEVKETPKSKSKRVIGTVYEENEAIDILCMYQRKNEFFTEEESTYYYIKEVTEDEEVMEF